MSLALLDLNDHDLGLYEPSGLILSSPGYVLAQGKQPVFGFEAVQQSRLHPVSVNNEFWHRLGMNPLTRPLANFRHHADIAYGHLMQLAQTSEYKGDVVLSVPGSFSREQLAILSGVIKHSPFKPVAMVDAALASLLAMPGVDCLIYVDMQLHQLTLTRVVMQDGQVRRDAFCAVTGAGWVQLANTIVQVATDAFISQERFNPQHKAEWEQALYNALPDWLQQFNKGQPEVTAQIQTDKNLVQARISLSDVQEALEPAFRKISQQLEQLLQGTVGRSEVLLSERAATIPGLQECLQATTWSMPAHELARLLLQAAPPLAPAADAIPLLTSLKLNTGASISVPDVAAQRPRPQPTHLLCDGQAWPLPLAVTLDGEGNCVMSAASTADSLLSIRNESGQVQLIAHQPGIRLAGKTVEGSQAVYAGDSIRVSGLTAELQCIRVIA